MKILRYKDTHLKKVLDIEKSVMSKDYWDISQYQNLYLDGFICIINNNIVGYVLGEDFNNYFHIYSIGVKKQYRNKKIGSLLMNKIIKKYENISLDVDKNNNVAISFFKSFGFLKKIEAKKYFYFILISKIYDKKIIIYKDIYVSIVNNRDGKGVFANKKFLKGDIVYKSICIPFNKNIDEIEYLNKNYFYNTYNKNSRYLFPLGISIFINNSDYPNIIDHYDSKNNILIFKALKNIQKNEELIYYGY